MAVSRNAPEGGAATSVGGMGRDDDGQVSEVQQMDEQAADTPISDDQAVAGQPAGESGLAQEGPTGPNAEVPGADDDEPEIVHDDER